MHAKREEMIEARIKGREVPENWGRIAQTENEARLKTWEGFGGKG